MAGYLNIAILGAEKNVIAYTFCFKSFLTGKALKSQASKMVCKKEKNEYQCVLQEFSLLLFEILFSFLLF